MCGGDSCVDGMPVWRRVVCLGDSFLEVIICRGESCVEGIHVLRRFM